MHIGEVALDQFNGWMQAIGEVSVTAWIVAAGACLVVGFLFFSTKWS